MTTNVNVDKEKYVTDVNVTFTPLEFLTMRKSLQYFIENNENTDDTVLAWDMYNTSMSFSMRGEIEI